MIDAVLPVCGVSRWTWRFMRQYARCAERPTRLWVVDARPRSWSDAMISKYQSMCPEIEHVRCEEDYGVNWAWNWALKRGTAPWLVFLNNDVDFPPHFFACLYEAVAASPLVGVIVPDKAMSQADVELARRPDRMVLGECLAREGWAFAVRRDAVAPIPEGLRTFYGDTWLFESAKRNGYAWARMVGVPVYHHVSQTLYRVEAHRDLPTDRAEWNRIMSET